MREQTQYTTMLPNYNIPTDMQAPFHSTPFSVQPGPVVTGQPPTTAHRPMQAIQCTTEAAPLFSSESRESGRGRWWAVEEEEKTSPPAGTPGYPLPAQPLVRSQTGEGARALSHTRVPLASAQLFPTPGYPLPAHSLSHTRVPLASAQRARHPPYSARYGAPSAYSAERSAPSTSASSAMRTYMPFSISIK